MLTDKQIEDIALKYTRVCVGYRVRKTHAIPKLRYAEISDRDVIDFARAIEKAVLTDNDWNDYILNRAKELEDADR